MEIIIKAGIIKAGAYVQLDAPDFRGWIWEIRDSGGFYVADGCVATGRADAIIAADTYLMNEYGRFVYRDHPGWGNVTICECRYCKSAEEFLKG